MPVNLGVEGGLPGLTVDQTHMMAPMDLYDSIWGGKHFPASFVLAYLYSSVFFFFLVSFFGEGRGEFSFYQPHTNTL